MNILVPHDWLLDHLETTASPEELQRMLSLSGPSVEGINHEKGEKVLDVEVTTNRMDSASIRGVAREAAVILTQADKPSRLKPVEYYKPEDGEVSGDVKNFPIKIQNDPKLCSRVIAAVLSVKTQQSPKEVSTRLAQVGVRSLNNLVDVTNYVMTEVGHPCHVFDADRLGETMIIRESKKGEKLTTLDGKTRALQGGDIVVDNGKGELTDLIGIMGTKNSVVTEHTKRILFFIEHADPARIRKTSMGLAIRTSAAQLNEKMLDPNLAMEAFLRGIHLFQEVADAKLESHILDLYPNPVLPRTIRLSLSLVQTYLGIELPGKVQAGILEQLGAVVVREKDELVVTVPTLRPDLEIPVDLIEEIARIYGYHNLPSTLMTTAIPTNYPQDTDFALEHSVKEFLATLGWQEVYTYSAVSAALAEASGAPLAHHLKLLNPLNDEHIFMRRSLVPSHLEIIEKNRHLQELSIFELANVYLPREKDLPEESLRLTMTSTRPFRIIKGQVEALLRKLHIPSSAVQFNQNTDTHADIVVDGIVVGSLLVDSIVTIAGFIWKELLRVARRTPSYTPISQFAPIIEEMTFTLPEKTGVAEVIYSIQSVDPIVKHVELKIVYKQNYSFVVQYALANKQIQSEDVAPLRKKMVEQVEKKHKATFVGKL